MMDIAKSLMIEVRHILKAAQVYVTFHNNVSSDDIRIQIKHNAVLFILVKDDSSSQVMEVFDLKPFGIVPNSFSGICTVQNGVWFRLSFSSVNSEDDSVENYLKSLKPDMPSSMPSITIDEPLMIVCRVCKTRLIMDDLIFKRILPLPSAEDVDFSDAFCHDFPTVFTYPNEDDLLYSRCYVWINKNYEHLDDGVVRCTKCKCWLGIKSVFNLQLWIGTVIFVRKDAEIPAEIEYPSLRDFVFAIQDLLNSVFATKRTILVKCTRDNVRTSKLLLVIMDRKLNILFSTGKTNKRITLSKTYFMKVLFDYDVDGEYSYTEQNPIDLEVSEPMFLVGIKYLFDSHKLLPELCSFTNNLKIGYLPLEF